MFKVGEHVFIDVDVWRAEGRVMGVGRNAKYVMVLVGEVWTTDNRSAASPNTIVSCHVSTLTPVLGSALLEDADV